MPDQKRHHFVPEFYLLRFADQNERVFVRRRDGGHFVTNIDNVAAESGFYDVVLPDGEKSKEVEDLLNQVEGDAAEVLRGIDSSGAAPSSGSEERVGLSYYLGLQMTRTREHRERTQFPLTVAAFLSGRDLTRDLMHEFLSQIHLGFTPNDGEVQGALDYTSYLLKDPDALTKERSLELMFDTAKAVAPILASLNWSVEHDRKGHLLTSDTPLVIWTVPSPKDAYMGTGVVDADEIRFPLDPAKQLIMTKHDRSPSRRISPERSAACNQDMALGCHNFVVASPAREIRTAQLDLPERRPVLRFNTGPLIRQQPDGSTTRDGEVMHMWVPRR